MSMSFSSDADQRFFELLGLALTLGGTLTERIETLIEYVRLNVLDDYEAVLLSQDQFDFEAQQLRLGQLKGAIRADIDASSY